MFASCAEIFVYYQGLDPLSAALASVSTITTIGIYSPGHGITSLPATEQLLLILTFLVAVGSAASLVQGVVSQAVNRAVWTEEVLDQEVQRMKGHTIIMGYSHLGRFVASKLDELGIQYVVVIHRPEDLARLRAEGVAAFAAPAKEFHRVLEKVGVRRAGTMICTFEDDTDNLMAILYANKVRPELRILSAVHDIGLVPSAQMAGADVVLPVSNVLGGLLAVASISREVAGVLLSSKIPGRYLAEFTVPGGRPYTFGQLNQIAPVLLLLHGEAVKTNPPDDYVVPPGTLALFLASSETIRQLRAAMGTPGLTVAPPTPGSPNAGGAADPSSELPPASDDRNGSPPGAA